MATVKTYRALKQQNVEGQVRHYGDFVPEASSWPNLAVWLRSGHIEETFIDSEELEEALKIQRANDGVDDEVASEDGTLPATDDDADETEEEIEEAEDDESPVVSVDSTDEAPKVLKIKKGKK